MKIRCKILSVAILLVPVFSGFAQRINVGITFQYLILKQVKVNADVIEGTHSYSRYQVIDNRWKFFSAGQSIIIGTVVQVDYKKLYCVLEPSFDLNTYHYRVSYPVSPQHDERLNFQTLFLQVDIPFYFGYQFGATNLIRYSVFAGAVMVLPYKLESSFPSKESENLQEEYYNTADMDHILYNAEKYANGLLGFCVHFASLGKIDIRYQQRIGSPAEAYKVGFQSLGFALTYYLPLNLRKKKIYYED